MMINKVFRFWLIGLSIICVLLVGWIIVVRWGSPRLLFPREVALVQEQVGQIEEYFRENGRYPSAEEISLPSERMFYDLEGDGGYRIGFSVDFDETYYYDARTEKWSFEH